jgi:nucleotide-binding universal stress UspA family protein
MRDIKNILVPIDFSAGSSRAVELACAMAKAFRARITLLHVLHLPNPEYGDAVYATVADRTPSLLRSCEAALQTEGARITELGIETTTLLREGNPAHEIVDVARGQKVDLLVIATQARGRLSRGLLGSVTEKVMRLSPVPVLTLHAFEITR